MTLQKKMGAQFIDEIGSNILMGCGYTLVEGSASEQGTKTPRPPVPGSSSLKLEAALEENSQLRAELTAVKTALDEEYLLMLSSMKISSPFSLLSQKNFLLLLPDHPHKLFPSVVLIACSHFSWLSSLASLYYVALF